MRELIVQRLKEIERENNVKILLAAESGSRAWGIASSDSDYDVRFIYARKMKDYLRLEDMRDVIELPISDELDINGWDLKKSLRLLYGSNPTLFEWLSSPIVYMKTPFYDRLKDNMLKYFSQKKCLYHYLNMAERNCREHLNSDTVKAKKYFYVLRPVLACRWILDRHTPPPMLFCDLSKAELPFELSEEVSCLLRLKTESNEVKEIPKIVPIDNFLCEQIEEIKGILSAMPDEKGNDISFLDELFLLEIS